MIPANQRPGNANVIDCCLRSLSESLVSFASSKWLDNPFIGTIPSTKKIYFNFYGDTLIEFYYHVCENFGSSVRAVLGDQQAKMIGKNIFVVDILRG
jgi:hypothetical protein